MVSNYIFTSQKKSHSFLIWVFRYPSIIFSHLLLMTHHEEKQFIANRSPNPIPNGVQKCNSALFLYIPPHKGLTFSKNYLCATLIFSHSLKTTCILLRQVISLKSHPSGVMVNITFPVMSEAIWRFEPNLTLYIRIVLNKYDLVELISIVVL